MTYTETKVQQRTKHKLKHRAAQLRKVDDELDALAAELDREERESTSVENELGPPS